MNRQLILYEFYQLMTQNHVIYTTLFHHTNGSKKKQIKNKFRKFGVKHVPCCRQHVACISATKLLPVCCPSVAGYKGIQVDRDINE